MQRQLLRTVIIASFAAIACSAGAQNATPSDRTPPATPNAAPALTPPTGVSGTTTYPSTGNAQVTRGRMTDDQIREYMDARKACSSQPASQMEMCNSDVNKKFSSVDAKCQKLSGTALADCLRGADHGG
jgi:hypothetical protein